MMGFVPDNQETIGTKGTIPFIPYFRGLAGRKMFGRLNDNLVAAKLPLSSWTDLMKDAVVCCDAASIKCGGSDLNGWRSKRRVYGRILCID
jgi:hypothetical protein